MIAAWIKFNHVGRRLGYITPLIVTLTLAICMIGMLQSIIQWASHLFEPKIVKQRELGSSLRGVATHDTAGLPFDWHRLPCETCSAPLHMPCAACARASENLHVRPASTAHPLVMLFASLDGKQCASVGAAMTP